MQITENLLPEAIPEFNALVARVTLPSYKVSKSQSEETTAFTSKIALDGVVVGDARNDGRGGSDTIWIAPEHRAAWGQVVRDFQILTGEDFEAESLLVAVVAEMVEERRLVQTMFRKHGVPTAVAIEKPSALVVVGVWENDEKGIHAALQRHGIDPNLPRRVYRREGR